MARLWIIVWIMVEPHILHIHHIPRLSVAECVHMLPTRYGCLYKCLRSHSYIPRCTSLVVTEMPLWSADTTPS
jgi:hypothetical protein